MYGAPLSPPYLRVRFSDDGIIGSLLYPTPPSFPFPPATKGYRSGLNRSTVPLFPNLLLFKGPGSSSQIFSFPPPFFMQIEKITFFLIPSICLFSRPFLILSFFSKPNSAKRRPRSPHPLILLFHVSLDWVCMASLLGDESLVS